MELKEVQEYMTTNKDTQEVKDYVKGFTDFNGVKNFLETSDDGKQYMNSFADSKVTKGIESYKTNNFDKDYTDRFNRENPTADPLEVAKNKKVSDLEATITKMQNDSVKDKLTTKALKTLQIKELTEFSELIDKLVGSDETTTTATIDMFAAMLTTHDEKLTKTIVEERFKGSYIPPTGTKTTTGTTKEDFNKMEYKERMALYNENQELYNELNK